MTDHTYEQTTLVLGGTGKTGRRIVERLEARGRRVRVGTPSATPPFDWTDKATWPAALDGMGSVYVTYYPDLAIPGAAEAVAAFATLAVARGVPRQVLLSGRGEEGARRGEQALQQSGADWTIVRSAFMAQNFNESFFVEPVRAGEVAFPADQDLTEPFIDADDIADVAVAALTEDGHVGRLYEVTGPRLLTWADAVAEIATAVGHPIRYLPVSLEDYAALLIENQVPADYVKMLTRRVHRGPGRPQRPPGRRRPACPWPAAPGLRRLRPRRRCHRRLERLGRRLRARRWTDSWPR